jgi:hypothetical protein
MHATRSGQEVTVHANCGIDLEIDGAKYVSVRIRENAAHMRYFHGQLGRLLDEAEAEEKAKEARE